MDLATFQKETKDLEKEILGTGAKVRQQPYHEKFDTFFENATEQLEHHSATLNELENILKTMCEMFGEPANKASQVHEERFIMPSNVHH